MGEGMVWFVSLAEFAPRVRDPSSARRRERELVECAQLGCRVRVGEPAVGGGQCQAAVGEGEVEVVAVAARHVAQHEGGVDALREMSVEQAGVGQHVERGEGGGPVAGVRHCVGGEVTCRGDVAAAEGAPRGEGEQGGAAGVVGREPFEEQLCPHERLVDEPAVRVQV